MADRPSKVLIIGSGPIVIGQAAEFDYSGSQACRALREEGVVTVLVNSNPATIMTDPGIADIVYIEPLTVEVLERIIARERPDGLLPTLGGQTGLNLAVDLARAGVLDRYGVRLLGTPLDTIQKAEDRDLFRQFLQDIGEPQPFNVAVHSWEEARRWASSQAWTATLQGWGSPPPGRTWSASSRRAWRSAPSTRSCWSAPSWAGRRWSTR